MILTLEMRASIRCNDCSVRNPLPGLRTSATCVQCGAHCDVLAVHKQNHEGGVRYDFGGYPLWATSTAENLRRYVATHIDKDSPLLEALTQDADASVRLRVAQRPSITAAQIETLMRDNDATVRLAIAGSSHVDAATLKHLSKDHDPNVAAAAKQHPKYEKGFFEKLFS